MVKRINNKGQVTMFLLVGLLIILFGAIILITLGFVSTNLNDALDIDVDLGQVNLQEVNADTIGKFNEMVVNNADFWGLALIFGMVIGLWGGAYFTRNTYPKLGVLIDIGIIFVAFLISLYFRGIYSDVIVALSSAGQTFAIDYMDRTNFFILNLPIFITIIGVGAMVIFHMGMPKKTNEINTVSAVTTG